MLLFNLVTLGFAPGPASLFSVKNDAAPRSSLSSSNVTNHRILSGDSPYPSITSFSDIFTIDGISMYCLGCLQSRPKVAGTRAVSCIPHPPNQCWKTTRFFPKKGKTHEKRFWEVMSTRIVHRKSDLIFSALKFPCALRNTRKSFREFHKTVFGAEKFSGHLRNALQVYWIRNHNPGILEDKSCAWDKNQLTFKAKTGLAASFLQRFRFLALPRLSRKVSKVPLTAPNSLECFPWKLSVFFRQIYHNFVVETNPIWRSVRRDSRWRRWIKRYCGTFDFQTQRKEKENERQKE